MIRLGSTDSGVTQWVHTRMESQMEKNMESEMETGII